MGYCTHPPIVLRRQLEDRIAAGLPGRVHTFEQSGNGCFGSLADLWTHSSLMSAFERKADIAHIFPEVYLVCFFGGGGGRRLYRN